MIATKFKRMVRRFHRKLKIIQSFINSPDNKLTSLKPVGAARGNVLISYKNQLFLTRPGPPNSSFQHHQENFRIEAILAQTFLDLGYSVEIISNKNKKFLPKKEYAFFLDTRNNMQRLSLRLNKNCVKILFLTTAHPYFHNAAAANRLLALQERKHVTLKSRRFMPPEHAIAVEYADCIIDRSDFGKSNFRYANKPFYRLPHATSFVYPWPEAKDFEACRTRFLWLGSGGMVHKGLDLVLEAFVQMPSYHLTVCGPVERDKDFEQVYYHELYHSSNIHTYGWIDVGSPEFIELANSCVGLVYPSCSEGSSGAVITCLHAGLIPIVSYESGVDVSDDVGVILRNCSIEEIRESVQSIYSLSTEQLKQMSRNAWEYARANHTMEKVELECRKIVEKLIADYQK